MRLLTAFIKGAFDGVEELSERTFAIHFTRRWSKKVRGQQEPKQKIALPHYSYFCFFNSETQKTHRLLEIKLKFLMILLKFIKKFAQHL